MIEKVQKGLQTHLFLLELVPDLRLSCSERHAVAHTHEADIVSVTELCCCCGDAKEHVGREMYVLDLRTGCPHAAAIHVDVDLSVSAVRGNIESRVRKADFSNLLELNFHN